ncbi:carbohydrate kinase family protein [Streptomyces somaliensis DSM 40738]|uniref:Carbohydrate kinase family protein n=1 Tax=Streptomyces somaliensis (strain ATCC 33201 / DSM 40738 / JCM 12659 / KCTC 9044 / NCTC 11332 / NRRL B-12077 / IP 733) TaxID=1134445 RepID=A0AA44DBG6_STRE0|nr:carbohydrate kinase family protein [Streptomyces somaliensis]MCQ0025157.1 carbohydrate kinase family protein [Streptomyces somaliensis DSM 40738]NKY13409.1 carbohydrate kinase family protein [Streptomyces somaliensis DSM 40738]
MRIVVTGSIATDHLTTFPGRFSEQLLPEQLASVSLSFLVDDLQIRRGGVAANIAFGLGLFGVTPLLVGAVGTDFAEYGAWLRMHGVDISHVKVSEQSQTARFTCITDRDQNQIAAFYPGAMAEARRISLVDITASWGRPALVVIAPDDPLAMQHHTSTSRRLNIPYAADPSQQLARLENEETRRLIDGAQLLFSNEYEAALLCERTGWTEQQVLDRVGTWITTRGANGVTISTRGEAVLTIPAVPSEKAVDPTGVGDGFRAGYLVGVLRGLSKERAAQLGCALATTVLETVGTQEYRVSGDLLARVADAYGAGASVDIARCVEVPG